MKVINYTSEEDLLNRGIITLEEYDETIRARAAIKNAIEKTKACGKPVARYDSKFDEAYLEYPNGVKQIII